MVLLHQAMKKKKKQDVISEFILHFHLEIYIIAYLPSHFYVLIFKLRFMATLNLQISGIELL